MHTGQSTEGVRKTPTGIAGLDEVSAGGLPVGRLTLVRGAAGTGKTAMAMELLYRGATEQDEPGIFVAFEEGPDQVDGNASTFAWHVPDGAGGRVAYVDARLPEPVLQEGEFDLHGLLAGLSARAEQMGARRVVFDGLDVLLAFLPDERIARGELMRIQRWVLERNLMGLVTAKSNLSGAHTPSTDYMEFAVDCVTELRHQVADRTSHRTLRVAKLRGSPHSADEYPFAITGRGLVVSTRGGAAMEHEVSNERVPTGVSQLGELTGGGYWRGSSILISGAPGTAKSTLGGAFAEASCAAGEQTLFVSFDEASEQIVRNLSSVGIDLGTHAKSGRLLMRSFRTRSSNLELHTDRILELIEEHGIRALVVDPISGFEHLSAGHGPVDAATRLIDACKRRGVTVLTTSLVAGPDILTEQTPVGLSTIADVWIHLSYLSQGGERNRTLSIVKARGTPHSNQVRELLLSSDGIRLADVYAAGGEVLLGTRRWEKEREQELERRRARRRAAYDRAAAQRQLASVEQRLAALEAERESIRDAMEHADEERVEERESRAAMRRGLRSQRGESEPEGEG